MRVFHAAFAPPGDRDFRLCLRCLPAAALRAITRVQGFDSAGRTSRWRESERLACFIADSGRARMSKGASFLARGESA